jgi:hypothetical protein
MKIANIALAAGFVIAAAGMAPVAFADEVGSGIQNCDSDPGKSAQPSDPTCSLNSGHDNNSNQNGGNAPQ